jgi:hypothetical protein
VKPAAWCVAAGCLSISLATSAQYRSGDQPVVERPVDAPKAAPFDVAPRFAEAYRRAGQPRIVLLWNRMINENASARVVEETVKREGGKRSDSGSERTTQGPNESARTTENDSITDRSETVTSGKRVIDDIDRKTNLSERQEVMLQRGFAAEMNRGGVQFIDRALVMRTTSVSPQHISGDAKLLEIDALLRHGDVVLEILMVQDADSPIGYGFDVRAKDLRRGQEITTLYSRAIPAQPLRGSGIWVPGTNGYEFQIPPAPPPPSPAQVGLALARDVMLALGGNLQAPASPSRR